MASKILIRIFKLQDLQLLLEGYIWPEYPTLNVETTRN